MYLPPNGASNGSFLETLRLLLVHETRDRRGDPRGLELAYSTPRAWLTPGKRIVVRRMPTGFGPVSYSIESHADEVRVSLSAPTRQAPAELRLRLRLPGGRHIASVTVDGRHHARFDARTGTIDLSGHRGTVELRARVA
jgi:hypothetical protein